MNYQFRGFRLSFVIHAALLVSIIVLDSPMARLSRPVVIDFSMESPSMKVEGHVKTPAPKSQDGKVRQLETPEPKPAAARQEPVLQKTVQQQALVTSETAAVGQSPVTAPGPSAGGQPVAGTASAAPNTAKAEGETSSARGQGNHGERTKQSYLKEHFAYIRDIVQQKLSYPKIAKKMGWEGKVTISFIVCLDGHARDIAIREGSGIELLDKNAVAAVQQASPFPKPPVEALLVIPVSYVLN